ncbi:MULTISPECIES: TIGR00730 family Rossman fold protein [Kaistia]|uniref:Cytokinin riboside 5'-monophosphate phosphoribohydrolase n=1 Tax=Kaistia nematophila TaxID=2994654 RepID=A0A9X3IJL3_9HYPH|nr:TIGR00730 family Rossman fold protein [Kaistia nematophila]MBN9025304.1 TIGR00730 family Rossman fold protein [Hyphomicrobiales bacterium]MCX5568684.1 TIGR00730 family Rossman fold protein [Kaistia nematophila]
MTELSSICVYCGSSTGDRPVYAEFAERLGDLMGQEGLGLVYGGGAIGLMGITARSVMAAGGHVTGIIPQFLKEREVMLETAHELIVTEDMHERKRMMFERSDAFVALPGGIGTLEELVEMMTWAQLGRHRKPVLIANINGFWDPLIALLRHMADSGFIRRGFEVNYLVVDSAEQVLPKLREAIARTVEPAPVVEPMPIADL